MAPPAASDAWGVVGWVVLGALPISADRCDGVPRTMGDRWSTERSGWSALDATGWGSYGSCSTSTSPSASIHRSVGGVPEEVPAEPQASALRTAASATCRRWGRAACGRRFSSCTCSREVLAASSCVVLWTLATFLFHTIWWSLRYTILLARISQIFDKIIFLE